MPSRPVFFSSTGTGRAKPTIAGITFHNYVAGVGNVEEFMLAVANVTGGAVDFSLKDEAGIYIITTHPMPANSPARIVVPGICGQGGGALYAYASADDSLILTGIGQRYPTAGGSLERRIISSAPPGGSMTAIADAETALHKNDAGAGYMDSLFLYLVNNTGDPRTVFLRCGTDEGDPTANDRITPDIILAPNDLPTQVLYRYAVKNGETVYGVSGAGTVSYAYGFVSRMTPVA